jgi:hypothetical protein
VPRGVLLDASYGSNKALRDGITALGPTYPAALRSMSACTASAAGN